MSEQIQHDQDAEILLDTLLRELPDTGLITWSGDGRITSLSERCRELMQLPASTAVGGSIEVLAESPCRDFMQTYEAFLATTDRQAPEQEFELSRDGESYWLSLSLKRCPKACSRESAFLMVVRDVTLRRRSMQQARQTEGYLDAALRAIPDAAVFFDADGRVTKISAGAERIFGYREGELLGKPVDLLADGLAWRETPREQGRPVSQPAFQMLESVAKDGHRFSSEAVTDWIWGENRALLGAVAILRDISDRQALQDDLLQQTLLLDSIFRQLPFALGVIDTQRQIVQMSDAALTLFGYRQEQMANHSTRMLYASDEEFERIGKAIYREKPGVQMVADLMDAAGRGFQGRLQIAPLYAKDQALRGYLLAVEDVTEQLARDEELRRYGQIVSTSSDALIFVDRRHIYCAVNDAYLELWKKTREEIIGQHVSDVVGESFYLTYARPALKRCFAGEPVFYDAIEMHYPCGKRYIDARHTPYRNGQGEISGVVVTLRDVTQRHLAERSMLESHRRFEHAGEFAEFAVWELDAESREPVDDHMMRRLLGYSAEDKLDSLDAWLELVVEADRPRMVDSFERIMQDLNQVERLECRVAKKNGELVHLETLIEGGVRNGKGRFIGITRDITAAVQESRMLRQYERMTQASQDGLALVDRQHVYRAVNSFYTRQFGQPQISIVGKSVASLLGDTVYQEAAKPMLDRCFAGEEPQTERWADFPLSGRRRVEVKCMPYRDDIGEITNVLVSVHDVTERYLSQLAMQESEAKFRAIFNNTPIGVAILEVEDGAIVDVNEACLRMHGYTREEFLSLKPWEVVVGITQDNFGAEWRRVTERHRSRFESEHRRKGGSTLQVLADASRMQLNDRTVIISTLVNISQQKELELRLREQQSQYRMLVESSNAILFAADPQTLRFSFVSAEAETLLGYPLSEWMENPDFWVDHLHPEDRAWAPDYCRSMVARLQDHDFDYRMLAADGRTVWLHDATSVIAEDGRVASLVGVIVDITAIKEAEAERRRLSEMVRQSADAVLLTDTDFSITYINEAFTRLYGFTLEDLRGQRPEVLVAEADAETIHPQVYSDLQAGKQVFRQLLNRRKDGSLFHCQHSITPLWNDQGDIIAYMSSQRDVTQRMQAEQALRESEEKYRQIVETAHEGIWVVDANAVTTFVNPRMAEMLGYDPREMLGIRLFRFMDEPSRHAAKVLWQRLSSEGRTALDLCFRRKDGSDLWCHISISAQLQREGEFVSAMALLTDISEQRQLTDALIRSQKMEAVGQLTGGIAHDFNNILGSILGFTELAQGRFGEGDAKLQDYLGQIATAGGRARDLVHQLLIFSRGENTQSATPIPVSPLVKEIIKMLGPMMPVAVEIRSELPQVSPIVEVEPLHIQQLLMNLCINARDAIGKRGVITVKVQRRRVEGERCDVCNESITGEWVAIRVTDSGRGIPQGLRDDIFQPFVTSKEVGEGSGMGLAVVRGIVNSYHGHVMVSSLPGEETSFEILLPEAAAESQGDSSAPGDVDGRGLSGRSVLVVDDEPQFLHYYQELLRDAGIRVIACGSGAQVLELEQHELDTLDLIITDQAMPGMSGSETVRHLRDRDCRVPAILCSGYGHEVEEGLKRSLQIVTLLHKPVTGAELLEAIRTSLSNRRAAP